MDTGHVISGIGHVGLIGWLFFGGFFTQRTEPFEVKEVAVISGAEFQAMLDAQQAPAEITETVQPAAPEVTPDAPEVPVAPEPEEPPSVPEPEVIEATPEEPPAPQEPPTPEVSEVAPEAPEPPAEVIVEAPQTAQTPVERPADRVAPTPAPTPEEDVRPSDTSEPAVTPEDTGETVEPPREAAVVPQATDRIVTEADEEPRAAVTESPRPPARRPEPPAPRVVETPTPTPAPPTENDTDAAVQAALEAALSSVETDVPTGPPLSSGEKDALRLAVQGCWVVDPGAQSAGVTVTIAMSMEQNGKVVQSSLRMIDSEGGDSSAVDAAFQAARRAILRCQKSGYDLPAEKYGQWNEIEMTFNPERMRIR